MSDAAAVALAVLVVGWIVPSISLVPIVARARLGSWASFFGWMIVSLLFSPILALLALSAVPPAPPSDADDDRIACPYCAEQIRPEATLCPHCRSDLTHGEVTRLRPR
jgi:hypothetical protein